MQCASRFAPGQDARLVGNRQENPGPPRKRQHAQNQNTPRQPNAADCMEGGDSRERAAERADRRRDAGSLRDRPASNQSACALITAIRRRNPDWPRTIRARCEPCKAGDSANIAKADAAGATSARPERRAPQASSATPRRQLSGREAAKTGRLPARPARLRQPELNGEHGATIALTIAQPGAWKFAAASGKVTGPASGDHSGRQRASTARRRGSVHCCRVVPCRSAPRIAEPQHNRQR